MSSSYTTRKRINKQGTGDNTNSWGTVLNAGALDVLDYALDGWQTLAISGNHTLSTNDGSTSSNEAGARVLKLTTATTGYIQTLPAREGWYLVKNSCTAAQTVASAGGGASVSVAASSSVLVFTDGAAVYELGYAGLGLKDYIDSAIVTATGSLPAVTGNNGKYLACNGTTWTPTLFAASAATIAAGSDTLSALTAANTFGALAEQTLTYAASMTPDLSAGFNFALTLTGNVTLGNPSAGMTPGRSGRIRIIQDATGSRLLSALGAQWKKPGGVTPTLSTAANAVDAIYYDVISATEIWITGFVKGLA